jgi:hypothetical protein
MKSRDIFEVCVRIMGLLFLYKALSSVPDALMNFCPLLPPPTWRILNFRSLLPSAIYVGFPLAIGWWMLRGAPWLMKRAFPEKSSTAAPQSSEQTPGLR